GRAAHPVDRGRAVQGGGPDLRAGGHGPGSRPGRRGDAGAGPGLRGGRDPAPRRRHQRELHRSPHRLPRDRRRADLPAPLAAHRPDRGAAPGPRPPRPALLPAGADRPRGADQGAPDL
ncbi:MAG: LSU ribosomal protein L19p, partial [uncultured Thermomicrobiales bacterium]